LQFRGWLVPWQSEQSPSTTPLTCSLALVIAVPVELVSLWHELHELPPGWL
jgi:hypothetical protein